MARQATDRLRRAIDRLTWLADELERAGLASLARTAHEVAVDVRAARQEIEASASDPRTGAGDEAT